MPIELKQRPTISAGDTDVGTVEFLKYLDTGELLTGTPTVVEITSTDLTIANVAVNTVALTDVLGNSVKIGQAVQFSVSGQVANTTYRLRVTAATDATVPRTVVRDAIIKVAATLT